MGRPEGKDKHFQGRLVGVGGNTGASFREGDGTIRGFPQNPCGTRIGAQTLFSADFHPWSLLLFASGTGGRDGVVVGGLLASSGSDGKHGCGST